ncbi:metallophosphoesterase [candidate division WOR-3 bacterium]|nr:metallophosphoesterase [candidate division WOR-3 bacterium]
MARSKLSSLPVLGVTFVVLSVAPAYAAPAVELKEYTIGAGSYGFDFVFFADFHIGEGKKSIAGMDDFGTPGYDDADNDPEETTPAIEGCIACVDYINENLVGRPGYDIRFIVAGGDFTSSSERSEWQRTRTVLGALDKRPFLVPLMGNHDGWPYVGHGLSFFPPFPGYFDEQPEDEVVVGEYFIDAFGGMYDTLHYIQPVPDWEQSEWLLVPTEKTCHRWPSYYDNFAFSFQGSRFIVTDFNTRRDPPPSERPGLRGEPDVYADQPYHWTLDWLKDQVAAVRPGERIICVGHHPYDQEYTNFQMGELRIISRQGLLNNRPIATSIGGHIHPFGDKPGRQLFGSDTAWDYYRPNAAKDGKVYVFRIRDSVRLAVTHAYDADAAGSAVRFSGAFDYEGDGNAPQDFLWDFGDGSPPQDTGSNASHVFPQVAPDTVYKVSLVVTTSSGRRVWACDTVHVLAPWVVRPAGKPDPAQASISVSPNPVATGRATFRYSLPRPRPATVTVCDVSGRVVRRERLALGRSGSFSMDLKGLRPGVYVAALRAQGVKARQKLVVER